MPKLTKKTVDAAKPKTKEYFVWDGDLPGFGLRVFPSGKKSYLVQYRTHGRTRRISIGLHGPFTPDMARDETMSLLCDTVATATVRTASPVTALQIKKEVFLQLMESDARVPAQVARVVSGRLVSSMQALAEAR